MVDVRLHTFVRDSTARSRPSLTQNKLFQFDEVMPPESTQQVAFASVRPFVQSAVDGHRCVRGGGYGPRQTQAPRSTRACVDHHTARLRRLVGGGGGEVGWRSGGVLKGRA